MNANAFRHFYDYHFAENRNLWNSYIVPLTYEQFTQGMAYSHGSVREQIIHLMNVDEAWFSSLRNVEFPESYEPADFDDRELIRARWDTVEQGMREYLANLKDEMLSGKPIKEPEEDKDLILWQVLLHVANHGTDHRAQLLRFLNDLGVKTSSQDYIFFVYDHPYQEFLMTLNPIFTQSATRPFELAPGLTIGGENIVMMAGPCAVESYEQVHAVAAALHGYGVRILRGGAFKPRTSPEAFQGLGLEGLEILRSVADEYGMLVITEALGVENLPLVLEYADIIQIGSRNMQHYPLLWAVGETDKPVLLKRGFMSTIKEWLMATEHIVKYGNQRIMLCERGIRTFETATRNTLDTNAIALVKQTSPFPVIGDPSHSTGRADLVLPASRAALAAGADGLIVEVHPDPAQALSDGEQSLPLEALPGYFESVRRVAMAMERRLD